MKRLILILFILLCAGNVWSQDISVGASISASKISIRDMAQLTITVKGSKDDIAPIELPKIDGLEAKFLGPSTSISIVNGQYSSEHDLIYNLFPTKTGQVQIPPINVTLNNKTYTTDPITLDIVDASVDKQDAPAVAADAEQKVAQALKERIFMTVSTPKSQVYIGQKVPITMKLFVNQLPLRNVQYPKLAKEGFAMDNFSQPQQYTQDLNGVKHDVVEFNTFIYPTRIGDVTFGPVELNGGLLYKSQAQNNPFNGFFNDDFFKGFFENYQERPVTVRTEPLHFKVKDLPEEGKPKGFSGAVGQINFDASISPTEVKEGDPVTLRMKISGGANFKSLPVPEFNDSRFKTYEAQIKDVENGKSIEQVIIPTSENITAVPAISYSYFDTADGQYKTLVQGPFPLKVTAIDKDQEFKAVGFNNLSTAASLGATGEQVDYIQKYILNPGAKAVDFVKTWQFWLMVLGILIIAGSWFLFNRFTQRLMKDKAFSMRLNAHKNAKNNLSEAKVHLSTGKEKDFYGALVKAIDQYLREKCGLSEDSAMNFLSQKKVDPGIIALIAEIKHQAEMVRFAGGTTTSGRMQEDLSKAQNIITALEKKL